MNFAINPLIALGVFSATGATDAAYVFFNAAVGARRRIRRKLSDRKPVAL